MLKNCIIEMEKAFGNVGKGFLIIFIKLLQCVGLYEK